MSDRVTVTLTRGQAEALASLCCYASAGDHEDVGMQRRVHARIDGAHIALNDALERPDTPANAIANDLRNACRVVQVGEAQSSTFSIYSNGQRMLVSVIAATR